MEEQPILGIGSRVDHPAFGTGVVIKLHPVAYDVCFITFGIKTIPKTYSEWEIIDDIEPEEEITFTAAENHSYASLSIGAMRQKWSSWAIDGPEAY